MRETSVNELLMTHRKPLRWHQNRGGHPAPGKSMAETYVLVMRCPVYRQRESHLGFRTELENLAGDGKGKGASGQTREAESTDESARGGLLRSSDEAG